MKRLRLIGIRIRIQVLIGIRFLFSSEIDPCSDLRSEIDRSPNPDLALLMRGTGVWTQC